MRPEQIRQWMRAEPFVRCRIYMSDGTVHEVHHPELVAVTARAVFIALPPMNGDELPDEFVWCDPIHITQIAPIREGRRENGKPREGP